MKAYVLDFEQIGTSDIPLVGGKGANLGELSRVDGLRVPAGFCVTTEAYRATVAQTSRLSELVEQLADINPRTDGQAVTARISGLSGEIRRAIESTPIPDEITEVVVRHLARLGADGAYAVRSSATAEDLAAASFAGQQDTYLNVVGREALLESISTRWASLFTDRAVTDRIQHGFDHREVSLAVVVQRMVFPEAAGVMFTADPITSNRNVISIDASYGLGEALVSALVNADNYQVRDGSIVAKKISAKKLAIRAHPLGGTTRSEVEPNRENQQTLTDEQILGLAAIGKRVETHFGGPPGHRMVHRQGWYPRRSEPPHHQVVPRSFRCGWQASRLHLVQSPADDD